MPALSDFDIPSLAEEFDRCGGSPAPAAKVLRTYYKSAGELDISGLQVGPKIRCLLASRIALKQSRLLAQYKSADGTIKILLGFDRGGSAEAVMMPGYRAGDAAGCISCQIGCAVGCDFCASGRGGLVRNLGIGEIVEQYLQLVKLAREAKRRLRTIVFMGMGEPMHNLDNVLGAIRRIGGGDTGALGWRQITVSTVGIVPGIERLGREGPGVHLAVSLHAPDDKTRGAIIPAARQHAVEQIVEAAREYQHATGRPVNIEYCLLDGINDSDAHAAGLADLLDGFRAHVNLISYNSSGAGKSGRVYQAATPQRARQFLVLLQDRGVVAHLRRPRGKDIAAACGQLAAAE